MRQICLTQPYLASVRMAAVAAQVNPNIERQDLLSLLGRLVTLKQLAVIYSCIVNEQKKNS